MNKADITSVTGTRMSCEQPLVLLPKRATVDSKLGGMDLPGNLLISNFSLAG